MASEDDITWIQVGIPGFDDLISKGIQKGSSILLSGGCGTGKTLFALQSLYHGASNGESVLYISLEEPQENLIRHMLDFGFDPKPFQDEGRFVINEIEPFAISRSVEGMLAKAKGEISIEISSLADLVPEGYTPDRVVIDSLTAISSAFSGEDKSYRVYIEQLFKAFRKMRSTVFLICETEQFPTTFSKRGVEEFLADGVFVLYNIQQGDSIIRAIEIRKLRATGHKQKIVPLKILEDKGVLVFPEQTVFNGHD